MVALIMVSALAVTLLCYRASPLVALALPVAVGFLLLACTAPAPAVVIGCSLAVLEGFQVPIGGLGALAATEVAFLLIAVGWVWRALSGAPGVCYPQIVDYPIIALLLCLPIGLAIGAPPADVLRVGVMWSAFFLVFLTVKGFSPRELRLVLLALGLSAGALGALGVIGYLGGGGARLTASGAGASGRAVAGIPDPNYYAAYLQMAAVPLLALVVAGRTRWRVVAAGAVALASAGVVLSLSRGGLLGLLLAGTVVVLAWARTRAVAVALVAIVTVTTLANLNPLLESETTEVVSERLASITVSSENNKRSLLWSTTLDEIRQHPIGVGALQFPSVSVARGLTQRGHPLENVHNLYLNIAVELGVLGLLCYLLWLLRVGWDLVTEIGRRRPETYAIVVGVAASLVGYSFQALTVSQYRVETICATFFVLTGVAAAARSWSGAQDPPADQVLVVAGTGAVARS
jgi:O-antigen ligase